MATETATVIVATFGDQAWRDIAERRAIPSANAQGHPVIAHHGHTLHGARNDAAWQADTDWLIFHDADDEWEPGFVDAMLAGSADLRGPRMVEVYPSGYRREVDLTGRDIERVNPLPISTAIRRELFWSIGGFRPWRAWEDWALWLTAVRRGATYEHIPGAVQLLHISRGSRN